jgi:hypothetical protein
LTLAVTLLGVPFARPAAVLAARHDDRAAHLPLDLVHRRVLDSRVRPAPKRLHRVAAHGHARGVERDTRPHQLERRRRQHVVALDAAQPFDHALRDQRGPIQVRRHVQRGHTRSLAAIGSANQRTDIVSPIQMPCNRLTCAEPRTRHTMRLRKSAATVRAFVRERCSIGHTERIRSQNRHVAQHLNRSKLDAR